MSQWKFVRSSSWTAAIPEADPNGPWLHLIIDSDTSANVLTDSVLRELSERVSEVDAFDGIRALIISSAKKSHFIAGADVNSIGSATDASDVVAACTRVQSLFGKLGTLSVPSICVIRGTCLGGGLELALGCTARIVVDDRSTKIGFPEVNLGIIPGFGGTVRTTLLLGLRGALQWILKAQRLPARVALRKGLADAILPAEGFRTLSLQIIEEMISDKFVSVKTRRQKRRKGFFNFLLDETAPGRALSARIAKKTVLAQTRGNMPAPIAAIDVARFSASHPAGQAFQKEAETTSELAVGPVCRNLVSIFQDSEMVRRGTANDPQGDWPTNKNLVI
ncbi:MAG: enoyl-CoA hydratase-related protein, partial [Planctomycetota bacterium]